MSVQVLAGGVRAEVQGRYLLRPAAAGAGAPAPLLVGFHGYAETADAHLRQMEQIPGVERWHLASIQALHPFYNPRTRQVVASWMTSLDREAAIADNARYVADTVAELEERVEVEGPTALLGFSQGTAMAYRAAALAIDRSAGVVALGGDVPPELGAVDWRSRPAVLIGRGRDDEWYDEAKLGADVELLEGRGVEVAVCRFDGGHEWTPAFRDACARFLASLEGRGA